MAGTVSPSPPPASRISRDAGTIRSSVRWERDCLGGVKCAVSGISGFGATENRNRILVLYIDRSAPMASISSCGAPPCRYQALERPSLQGRWPAARQEFFDALPDVPLTPASHRGGPSPGPRQPETRHDSLCHLDAPIHPEPPVPAAGPDPRARGKQTASTYRKTPRVCPDL